MYDSVGKLMQLFFLCLSSKVYETWWLLILFLFLILILLYFFSIIWNCISVVFSLIIRLFIAFESSICFKMYPSIFSYSYWITCYSSVWPYWLLLVMQSITWRTSSFICCSMLWANSLVNVSSFKSNWFSNSSFSTFFRRSTAAGVTALSATLFFEVDLFALMEDRLLLMNEFGDLLLDLLFMCF